MSYAHYFYGRVELTEQLLGDVASLLFAANAHVAGWNGEDLPEFDAERIRFNGVRARGEDAQFFQLTAGHNDGDCITAALPYDEVVTAVLLRVAALNPQFNVESDGQWRDWEDGVDLYMRVFDELPVRPVRIAA